MLVGLSLLAISLSVLAYHHPPSTWSAWLSARLSTGRGKEEDPAATAKATEPEPDISLEIIRPAPPSPSPESRDPSPQTTPKAIPSVPRAPTVESIPTFTLAEHQNSDEDDDEEDNLPPPSFPALNSAQRASAQPRMMAPPPAPGPMAPPSRPGASSLMPPPSLKASNLRALPTSSTSLRAPVSNGPLPNRGPIPNRSPNAGLAPQLSASSAVKTPNARGKVLLSPGHSPLDWANLQKSGTNLSGVPSLIRVTPSMLKANNGRKGKPAWSSYQGKVYNITPYLPFHPGGEGELRRASGKDGGKLFMEVHPWVNWENMLGECIVGIMVSEEQAAPSINIGASSSLEDMD